MSKIYGINNILTEVDNVIDVKGNKDLKFRNVKSIYDADSDSLVWIAPYVAEKDKLIINTQAKIIVCDAKSYLEDYKKLDKLFIISDNPKYCISQIITKLIKPVIEVSVSSTAIIDKDAVIGDNVVIGDNTVIGNCKIGTNCKIGANSIIEDNVVIGDNCVIENAVIIGGEGFNYTTVDEKLIEFPHIGTVKIGNDVTVKSGSYISSGVLSNTIISNGTKIAQQVYIGSNVVIGENCSLRPKVNICGSVKVGSSVTIGSSAVIRESVNIGEKSFIGMGAVVVKDVLSKTTVVGNPAKLIRK